MNEPTFFGHGLLALSTNLELAVLTVLYADITARSIMERKFPIAFVLLVFYPLYAPHAAYAFLEVKHLVLADGIADEFSAISVLVFGGLSLFGLFGSQFCILAIARTVKAGFWREATVILSAFVQATGATLGLLDVRVADAFLSQRTVWNAMATLLEIPELMILLVILVAFLSLVAAIVDAAIDSHNRQPSAA